MKFALPVLAVLILVGCSSESARRPPTAPGLPIPAPGSTTSLWGMVVDEGGVCIVGATVRVVSGQGLGQTLTQTTPCNAWGEDGGFVFRDLTPGAEMTLRASSADYTEQERTVVPSLGSQRAVLFAPPRK